MKLTCTLTGTSPDYGTVYVDEDMNLIHAPAEADANDTLYLENGILSVETPVNEYELNGNVLSIVRHRLNGSVTAEAWVYTAAPEKLVEFKYDSNGLRTQKKVTDHGQVVTTEYIYHGQKLVGLTCGDDKLHFFYDAQDKPAKLECDGETYTYISDLYGDITGLLDAVGNLVVEYRYDTWGRLLRISGIQASKIGRKNVFRYRGYAFDDETGLFYLRNRYYIPTRDRFLNADHRAGRRGDALTHNLFAYCDNRPIICLDQSGAGKTYVFYYYFPESKSPLKEQAMNSPYFDSSDTENVKMIAVKTSEDFINAWNAMEGEIDDVYLYLHGGAGYLQLAEDKIGIGDEFDYQLEELEEKSVGGTVYDFACHSAENYNGTSVAEVLANKTKTTVIACDVGVSYRFGNFILKIIHGNTWHARTETAHMNSNHWYKFTYNMGHVIKTMLDGVWRFEKN